MNDDQALLQRIAGELARHEAGHLVVGKELGFRMGEMRVNVFDVSGLHMATSAIFLSCALNTVAEVADYLRRRTKALYAGVLAQAMEDGVINNDAAIKYANGGGATDCAKARELIYMIRSIDHGMPQNDDQEQQQISAITSDLWNEAALLVSSSWKCIEALGIRLSAKVLETNREYVLKMEEMNDLSEFREKFGIDPIGSQGSRALEA